MVNKSDTNSVELVEKKRRKTTVTDSSVTKLSKDEIYTVMSFYNKCPQQL